MEYYIVSPDLDSYFPVGPSPDVDLLVIMDHLRDTAPYTSWVSMNLEVLSENDYGESEGVSERLADLMDFNASGIHVISERSRALLANLLDFSCDLLPVSLNGERYYLNHVLDVLDALDVQRSEIERFASGNIKCINRYVLKGSVIGNRDIFRLIGIRWQLVFVSGRFMEAVKTAGLSGFVFAPVEAR